MGVSGVKDGARNFSTVVSNVNNGSVSSKLLIFWIHEKMRFTSNDMWETECSRRGRRQNMGWIDFLREPHFVVSKMQAGQLMLGPLGIALP